MALPSPSWPHVGSLGTTYPAEPHHHGIAHNPVYGISLGGNLGEHSKTKGNQPQTRSQEIPVLQSAGKKPQGQPIAEPKATKEVDPLDRKHKKALHPLGVWNFDQTSLAQQPKSSDRWL